MKKAIVTFESAGSYQQSKHHETPKLSKEGHDAYEERTWRERCHYLSDGTIFIPNEHFKNCISDIARYLGEKIKGKGQATWTKHFLSGVRVVDHLLLPVKKDEVPSLAQFCESKGKRGGNGGKVKKYFPLISEWSGDVEFLILDDSISEDVFERYIREAGLLIGIGKQRPANGGDYGRFIVKKVQWKN
jgi:hypothetical protein